MAERWVRRAHPSHTCRLCFCGRQEISRPGIRSTGMPLHSSHPKCYRTSFKEGRRIKWLLPPKHPASSTHVQTYAARHPTPSCGQGVSCRCLPPDPFPSPQQSGGDQPSADSCLPDMPSSSMPSGCKQPSLSPLTHTPSSPLQTSPSSPLQTAPTEMEPASPNAQLEASPQVAHITPQTTPKPSKVLRKTPTYHCRARPTKHQVTRPSRPTKPTKRPVTRPSRLEQKLDTILTFFKCASQQLIPFLQDLERLKKDNNSLKTELQNVKTLAHSLQTSTPTPPAISLLSPSKPRDAPKEPTSTIDFIAVPTCNRFAVLQGQDEDKEESEDTDIVVCTDVHWWIRAADESLQLMNPCIYQTAPIFRMGRTAPTLPAVGSSTGRVCKPPVNSWQSAKSAPAYPTSLLETPWSPVSSRTWCSQLATVRTSASQASR